MELFSKLLFALKSHINTPNRSIDIKDVELSDCAERGEMARVGRINAFERSKATLPERTDETQNRQQGYNGLSHTHGPQRLDEAEVADTNKMNAERKETSQKELEHLRGSQERNISLPQVLKARTDDVEELVLARKTAADLREILRKTKADFRTQQKQMIVLNDALRSRNADLDKTIGMKAAAEQESEQLRSELETTRGQLQLCKDDLFRLQPMAQIPDTAIVKEFESMCQDIIGWIDVEISAFEKLYPSARSGQIFSGGENRYATYLLERYPAFGEYWVRFGVHHLLHQHMFSRSVYFLGLPKTIKRCLQAAEGRMASLEPPRDSETINAWRSETLTAIATTPEVTAHREAEISDISEEIFQNVGHFFPIIILQAQSKQRFLNEVVLPAAELASRTQLAASIYDFRFPANVVWGLGTVTTDDLKIMKMIDIKTRKTIKGSPATVQGGERHIGILVIPLEPSLRRINESQRSTLLRPEVNLIELD